MIKNITLKALLAGMLIGIGCVVYLNLKPVNSIVAAVAFSIALVSIVALELNLYTGKVGYLVYSNKKNIVDNIADLLLILSCNMTGVMIVSILCYNETIHLVATELCLQKNSKPVLRLIADSFMCGVLMFTAVESYKKTKLFIPVIMCVATFILCGFEHSIAYMGYFLLGTSSVVTLAVGFLMVIFNGVGSIVAASLYKGVQNGKTN